MYGGNLAGSLTNAGTIRKSAGTGTTTFNGYWPNPTNSGTIDVKTGTLAFSGNLSNNGSVLIGSNAQLTVSGISYTPPSIFTQPTDLSTGIGNSAQFYVVASGTPSPIFRWQRKVAGSGAFSDLSDSVV